MIKIIPLQVKGIRLVIYLIITQFSEPATTMRSRVVMMISNPVFYCNSKGAVTAS
jgi:hypothetical protein